MRTGSGGFTLIEVLVALVVLAVAVVAVLGLLGGGLRLVGQAGDHVAATLLAGARLSEVGPGPLQEETAEGAEGAFRWTRRVALEPGLVPLEAARAEATGVRVARVAVEVVWGRNRRVELVTLRAWKALP